MCVINVDCRTLFFSRAHSCFRCI